MDVGMDEKIRDRIFLVNIVDPVLGNWISASIKASDRRDAFEQLQEKLREELREEGLLWHFVVNEQAFSFDEGPGGRRILLSTEIVLIGQKKELTKRF